MDAGDMVLWGAVGLTAGVLAGTLAPARRIAAYLFIIAVGIGVGLLGGWAGAALGASQPVAFLEAAVVSVLAVLATVVALQRRPPRRFRP